MRFFLMSIFISFSFSKAPKTIIHEILKLQRSFLCGGGDQKRKVNWLSWEDICKSKKKGGLGIKNLSLASGYGGF